MSNLKMRNRTTGQWEEIKINARLANLRNTYTLPGKFSHVYIGITEFNPEEDILLVFKDSEILSEGTHYTFNEGALRIDSIDGSDWDTGTVFNFLVLKNVERPVPTADGSLIQDGSITDSKLAEGIKISPALIDTDGVTYDGLDDRLNSEQLKVKSVAEKVNYIESGNISTYFTKDVDFDSYYFRIPFCEITNNNVVIAGSDIRYDSSSDHDRIDVGIARSNDFGKTWLDKRVLFPNNEIVYNSRKMDATILVNRNTNRVFIFALVFDMIKPWTEATKQETVWDFVYKYSDDDGATWSNEISLKSLFTSDSNIKFVWGGVGKGITMNNGTLVLPIQIKNDTGHSIQSSLIYSTNNGATWQWKGVRVPASTSEANIVEYENGKLLINARSGISARRMYTTDNLGFTWIPHVTDRNTLIEPVGCQGSFDKIETSDKTLGLFLNPYSTVRRENLVLQATLDFINYYPVYTLYKGQVDGYSCLTNYNGRIIAAIEKSGNVEIHDLSSIKINLSNEVANLKTSKVYEEVTIDSNGYIQVNPSSRFVFIHVENSSSSVLKGIIGCKPNQEIFITNNSRSFPFTFEPAYDNLSMKNDSSPADGVFKLHVTTAYASEYYIINKIQNNELLKVYITHKYAQIGNISDFAKRKSIVIETGYSKEIIGEEEKWLVGDTYNGSIIFTLPPLDSVPEFHEISIRKKDQSTNKIQVKGFEGELIEGSNNFNISSFLESRRFVKLNTKWYVF
ncbi:sialidase family protein [Metabacillus arenae]|uniref:exo-alpha-sialidase n=1 Tax=Metabacillus arenae TaxID=2771434 RepID=A0A926RWJ7_9BACI|nr:sialidase family protein [Metabacillus arenae]MBD1379232.1 exo-alpha-sialidase [Metabacillus arenae]